MQGLRRRAPNRLLLIAVIAVSVAGCSPRRPAVPDGNQRAVSSLTGLLVMECLDSEARICAFDFSAGGGVRVLTPDCEANCIEPSLSSDGAIAFALASPDGTDIWQIDADGGDVRPLAQSEMRQDFPTWSPDGALIAYRVLEDPYTMDTPSGRRLRLYGHSSLHIAKADGTEEARLTRGDGSVLGFDWAPSGERLVVSARLEDLNQDGTIGDGDPTGLYVVDVTTREVRPILNDADPIVSMHQPAWSPSGAHIAYVEAHGQTESLGDLVIARADDGGEVARLDLAAAAGPYEWSPDGERIAYVGYPDTVSRVGYVDLFLFDLTTREAARITDTSLYTVFGSHERNGISLEDPTWSPDGSYLAFVWRTKGEDYIVVASADGSELSRVAGPGQYELTDWGE